MHTIDRQGHTAYRSEHAHAADGPKYGGGAKYGGAHFWVTNPFLRPGYHVQRNPPQAQPKHAV